MPKCRSRKNTGLHCRVDKNQSCRVVKLLKLTLSKGQNPQSQIVSRTTRLLKPRQLWSGNRKSRGWTSSRCRVDKVQDRIQNREVAQAQAVLKAEPTIVRLLKPNDSTLTSTRDDEVAQAHDRNARTPKRRNDNFQTLALSTAQTVSY